MIAWLLLSLVAVAAGWRFFPRYYFQLLPVMALLAARGYTLLGRCRAVMLALLLIPLIRFGPRYVMLANDLAHRRQSTWSDLALNEDSNAAADRIGHSGNLTGLGLSAGYFHLHPDARRKPVSGFSAAHGRAGGPPSHKLAARSLQHGPRATGAN